MAEICEQLKIEVVDEVGMMASLTGALKEAGVNIRAAVAWVEGANGYLRLVTDDNEKACDAMCSYVLSCGTSEAVCVSMPDEVGAMSVISSKLAEAGIGISLLYVSAGGGQATAVIETSDNAKAVGVL